MNYAVEIYIKTELDLKPITGKWIRLTKLSRDEAKTIQEVALFGARKALAEAGFRAEVVP